MGRASRAIHHWRSREHVPLPRGLVIFILALAAWLVLIAVVLIAWIVLT